MVKARLLLQQNGWAPSVRKAKMEESTYFDSCCIFIKAAIEDTVAQVFYAAVPLVELIFDSASDKCLRNKSLHQRLDEVSQ